MDENYANFLRSAFDKYLVQLDAEGLQPADRYISYDFESIGSIQWSDVGREMVMDELNEITNRLNEWLRSLKRWSAWNEVIIGYSESDAWELHHEFLYALAYYCLLQPSAIRDAFTFVATNAMHQVRLAMNKDYPDHLLGDQTEGGKRRHPSREEKEKQLAKIVSVFSDGIQFMESLKLINDAAYKKQQTADFRNLNNHAIGPRLGIGITRAVVRSKVPAMEMAIQSNGTYEPVPIPGKMVTQYAIGGTYPLNVYEALATNTEQYRRSALCYAQYRKLLASGLAMVPTRN